MPVTEKTAPKFSLSHTHTKFIKKIKKKSTTTPKSTKDVQSQIHNTVLYLDAASDSIVQFPVKYQLQV